MPLTITLAELKRFAPKAKQVYTDTLLDNLDILRGAGVLDNGLRLSHFMAQCAAETGGFVVLRESMAYRPARMRQVWPSRFAKASDSYLASLCADPVKLADAVYGGRMGNRKGTSDGFDYRGGMWLQTTGRYAVEKYCEQLGVEPSPQALDDPLLTLRFACLEWQQSGCNDWADKDDVLRVSKAINTGSATSNIIPVGLRDREQWLVQAKRIWEGAKEVAEAEVSIAHETSHTADEREHFAIPAADPPKQEESSSYWEGWSFAKVNELADQGSRLAQHLRGIKVWFWRLLFGTTVAGGGSATLMDTSKGNGHVVASNPHLLWMLGGIAVGGLLIAGLAYLFVKFRIEPGLVSAARDGRYSPRGAQGKA